MGAAPDGLRAVRAASQRGRSVPVTGVGSAASAAPVSPALPRYPAPAQTWLTRPLAASGLSDQLATELRSRIETGALAPGDKLPTEAVLATQFAVSRTVVREAVSRLRSTGLLIARQGSGVFVAALEAVRPLAFDASVLANLGAVLEVVEVRRALESETAALAAERATPAQRDVIARAWARVDASVASGSAAIDDDLAFHQAIAEASGNRQFARLLRHLEHYLCDAMAVTRRNESLKVEYIAEVRHEHLALLQAITQGDAAAAREAAAHHMRQAARRLHEADAPIQQRRMAATVLTKSPPATGTARSSTTTNTAATAAAAAAAAAAPARRRRTRHSSPSATPSATPTATTLP